MEIKNVTVVGAGLMGRQIAMNAAIYGYPVILTDNSAAALENATKWATEYLGGRIAKGRMTPEQVAEIAARLKTEPSLAIAVKDADLVIEAIVEVLQVKRDFFTELNKYVRPDTILATNSSYMVSSLVAGCVTDPSRLANAHFYNPALVMKFVEVVQGPHTSDETAAALMQFMEKTGKKAILMKKEIDGFAANRIIRRINEEAMFLVENGYCTPEDVDAACELGLGHPMGPFRLLDLTGIDLTYDIMKQGVALTGQKPMGFDIIEAKVKEGNLGRKTGKGFYDYTENK